MYIVHSQHLVSDSPGHDPLLDERPRFPYCGMGMGTPPACLAGSQTRSALAKGQVLGTARLFPAHMSLAGQDVGAEPELGGWKSLRSNSDSLYCSPAFSRALSDPQSPLL